jgi:hypothetical protein
MHRLLVTDLSQAANPYKIRFVYGLGTYADAVSAGQYSEAMFISASSSAAQFVGAPVDVKMPELDADTKVWAAVWCATDTATISFFTGLHEYETYTASPKFDSVTDLAVDLVDAPNATAVGVIADASAAATAADADLGDLFTAIPAAVATAVLADSDHPLATGADGGALISTDVQDLSATLSVDAKTLNGATPNNATQLTQRSEPPTTAAIATAVWANVSRTLTSWGTLVTSLQSIIILINELVLVKPAAAPATKAESNAAAAAVPAATLALVEAEGGSLDKLKAAQRDSATRDPDTGVVTLRDGTTVEWDADGSRTTTEPD